VAEMGKGVVRQGVVRGRGNVQQAGLGARAGRGTARRPGGGPVGSASQDLGYRSHLVITFAATQCQRLAMPCRHGSHAARRLLSCAPNRGLGGPPPFPRPAGVVEVNARQQAQHPADASKAALPVPVNASVNGSTAVAGRAASGSGQGAAVAAAAAGEQRCILEVHPAMCPADERR
jgi:hypothetical protein